MSSPAAASSRWGRRSAGHSSSPAGSAASAPEGPAQQRIRDSASDLFRQSSCEKRARQERGTTVRDFFQAPRAVDAIAVGQ